jgi:hypothetical protein
MTFWNRREIRFWHGTTRSAAESILQFGPDLTLSRKRLDFGAGFYVTTREARAVVWARTIACKRGELPAMVCWTHAYDAFQALPKLAFADAGHSAGEFWEFVRLNRTLGGPHRSPPEGWFDVVLGPASSRYDQRLAVEDLDQLSFHTDAGLEWLSSGSCDAFYVTP